MWNMEQLKRFSAGLFWRGDGLAGRVPVQASSSSFSRSSNLRGSSPIFHELGLLATIFIISNPGRVMKTTPKTVLPLLISTSHQTRLCIRDHNCQLSCHPRHLKMVRNYEVRRQKPSCSGTE
ncbi:hypothetical protein TNCV_163261 [Trichonephila clavipes]|nr:hypothetical protein TNCV_163261 [Trichonephila clavipes]